MASVERDEILRGVHGSLKSVSEFLETAAQALSDDRFESIAEAIRAAAPWVDCAASAVAEILPPLKLLLKLTDGLTRQHDPNLLGYVACTLAFQRAVEQAVAEVLPQRPADRVLIRACAAVRRNVYAFHDFSLARAAEHPFVKDATGDLEAFAAGLGFGSGSASNLLLQRETQQRFVINLKTLLCHGKTRGRFAPFNQLIALDTEHPLDDAVLEHAETQRWLFEEYAGAEGFALGDIYVEPECSFLTWGQISARPGGLDPFGPAVTRQPLLETVTATLADPTYRDVLVIQGPAGAGKSSFTLRLCADLLASGLTPLRIELKRLSYQQGLRLGEALPLALEINSPARSREREQFLPRSEQYEREFLRLFEQRISFRGATMCPYVLILDGLDELPLGANANYLERLRHVLADVEATFLGRSEPLVRVIVVGRPSTVLADARFLHRTTRVVTLLPWESSQLESFVGRIAASENAHPVGALAPCLLPPATVCRKVLARFRAGSGLAILGSPLLAHLCLRLLSETARDRGDDVLDEMIDDSGSLYRHMIDIVIEKAGKRPGDELANRSAMITGTDLRLLLQRTAEAMTVLGVENIAHGELVLRLETDARALESHVRQLEGKELLSRLLISFFFKGGHEELGCEFAHKSFREYLFAERAVTILKDYGQNLRERAPASGRDYWLDFDAPDPRYRLTRELSAALGPQWLAPEVATHIESLLRWELAQATTTGDTGARDRSSATNTALTLTTWQSIREGLADLWDWWGEGGHLRPQPRRTPGTRDYKWLEPLVVEVAREARLRDSSEIQPHPIRTVSIDAHLGDALCTITAIVHHYLAGGKPAESRPYQAVSGGRLRFAPSGPDASYFGFYAHRINAAGYRPQGEFPAAAWLNSTYLGGISMRRWDLRGAQLQDADLSEADLLGADLVSANLNRAELTFSTLSAANLCGADLRGVNATGARLNGTVLDDAQLRRADLSDAVMFDTSLCGADLRDVVLVRRALEQAETTDDAMDESRLPPRGILAGKTHDFEDVAKTAARCNSLTFAGANLSGVDLRGAYLAGADLTGVDFSGALLTGAELSGANVCGVDFTSASLTKARLTGARYSCHTWFPEDFDPQACGMILTP